MRLSALLFPVGVALFPIGVLLWYGLVHIPAQEAYLNARNLRLLTTLSAAIQAKIESFDGALDHAVESFDPSEDKVSDQGRQQALTDGVHLFARDLDILKVDSGPRSAAPGATQNVGTPSDIESQLLVFQESNDRIRHGCRIADRHRQGSAGSPFGDVADASADRRHAGHGGLQHY